MIVTLRWPNSCNDPHPMMSPGAQGKGMRFGSGQIALRVHDRYSYNVTAPRFVRLNDTFDVSVLFGTLYSASVEVTVGEDSGDIFELDRNVNKQMGRKSHKTQVQFNVRALGLGNGSLMISAGEAFIAVIKLDVLLSDIRDCLNFSLSISRWRGRGNNN